MKALVFATTSMVMVAVANVQTAGYRFEGTATWWWEASADGGTTWTQTLLEVPQEHTVVQVRASCAFPQVPRYYFGGAMIDQAITGVNGAGPNDSVNVLNVGFFNQQTIAVQRFGPILKIDDVSDTAPPGQGPGHLAIFQPSPAVGAYTYANPVTNLVRFDLLLDGTMGDRLINAWWRNWTMFFPNFPDVGPSIFVRHNDLLDLDFIFPTLTVHDLTIRVIPAPGAVALPCPVLLWSTRRRRARP
jgi:hypothetical protein